MADEISRTALLFHDFLQKRRKKEQKEEHFQAKKARHFAEYIARTKEKQSQCNLDNFKPLRLLNFHIRVVLVSTEQFVLGHTQPTIEPRMWARHLRMRKKKFLFLCRELSPTLEKRNTHFLYGD